jgi:MFS transporter, AAHS family, benzoate transport protein
MPFVMVLVTVLAPAAGAATATAYAYVSQFYPSSVCSTGVGFASGVGRIGGTTFLGLFDARKTERDSSND